MDASGRVIIGHNSKASVFRIWNLSDLHFLNKACAADCIQRDIDAIKSDPYSFWLGGGDYCDFIGYDDKRFDPDCVAESVTVADMGRLGRYGMEEIQKMFKPIACKCLGLLHGNHELRYEIDQKQSDLHAWLCESLGVANLHYSALFDLSFSREAKYKQPRIVKNAIGVEHSNTFRFFVHHGAGFAATPGGKLNKLLQFMTSFDADVYMIGHVHDHTGKRRVTLGANADCTKITQREGIGVIAGSYLKTYSQGVTTYGEQRGYAPTSLGAAVVFIKPYERKLWGEV